MGYQRAYNFYEDFQSFYDDLMESSASKRYIVIHNGTRVAYVQTGGEYPSYQFNTGDKVTLEKRKDERLISVILKELGFVTVRQIISVHGGTPTRDKK